MNIHYDVKIYDNQMERETIRGLTYGQTHSLIMLLERIGIRYKIIEII